MNQTRLPVIIIAVALLMALGFALRNVQISANATASDVKSVGFGDLRAVENNQAISLSSSANPSVGFGNLRAVEGQQALASSNEASVSAGFGSLRRLEGQQALSSASSASTGFGSLRQLEAKQVLGLAEEVPYVGMGDLHLLEAQQAGIR